MTGGDGDVKANIIKFLRNVDLMKKSLKEAADNSDKKENKEVNIK